MSTQTKTENNSKGFTLFIFAIIFILPFTNFMDNLATNAGISTQNGKIELVRDARFENKPLPLETQIVEKPTEPTPNLEIKNEPKKEEPKSQPRIDEIGVFVTDDNKSDLITKTKEYIAKYQKSESPLDAEMLVKVAQKNNFPLDLILIQAHTESHFCTNGRAVQTKNCWNIGNVDAGDTKATDCQDGTSICLDDYQKGFGLYIHYMTSCHFHEGETITTQKFFDRDFRQVRQGSKICGGVGKRYATDPNYRSKLNEILQNNFNPIFSK